MTKSTLLAASAIVLVAALPAAAQTGTATTAQNTAPTNGPGEEATSAQASYPGDIVITAQRQSQRLQDVPIAVTAFTADNLEKQQIVNPLALQQTLPNVTFTKGNFNSSTFTIRGIGDLCVGVTCDSATGVHINEMPIPGSRQLDNEFFDMERIEVLRGPQGTLFGRNATSGVVDLITAKPDLSGIRAAGEFEYGNYDSKKVKGMLNLPIGDTLGVRVAGYYLNRDGYTKNLFTGNRIDGRDLYSVRGTISWEPDSDTRLDLIANYTHEDDNRSRIQKQVCHRDPTGILGCSPDIRAFEEPNGNATLAGTLVSKEGLRALATLSVVPALQPALLSGLINAGIPIVQANAIANGAAAAIPGYYSAFGLSSFYGPDQFSGVINPSDVRTVNTDYEPTYKTNEQIYTAKFFHNFGSVAINLTGGYLKNKLDSTTDYNLAAENPYVNNSGLAFFASQAALPGSSLKPIAAILIPNGPNGGVCQSNFDRATGVGVFGGNTVGCYPESLSFDRSYGESEQYSIEGHLDTSFDGAFNFLLGGIYFDNKAKDVDYYVGNFPAFDYFAGVFPNIASTFLTANGLAPPAQSNFSVTPYYRSNSREFELKSYGIFGEAYIQPSDQLKITLGLRYNNDKKIVSARTTTFNTDVPVGTTDANPALDGFDFDATIAGQQAFQNQQASFDRLTGRAVVDYKITSNNLLYASYSRGYKSGGINPPLTANLATGVPQFFRPEQVDSYEIGSKNTFAHGQLRLNLTGFYYKYKNLQLTRIVNRTSVNDNINAKIYGVEAEAIVSPVPAFVVNMNFSYLHSGVDGDRFLVNPRDVSGGRSDAVIIKDIQARNCAVVPTTAGNGALANGFVAAANAGIGLQGPVPVPGTNATGAFSSCDYLAAVAPAGITVLQDGVAVNVADNKLPNTPTYKASIGAQYTIDFGSGFTLVPRADLNYTGGYEGTIFNKDPIDKIPGYEVVNAQIQLNAPDDKFYVRAFVSNLTNNDAITGLYVTDQSSGLFTNIFTIEPRRYGVAAGFKF